MIHCIRLERQIKQTLLVVDDIGHAPILTIFFTFHGLVSKDWLSHLFLVEPTLGTKYPYLDSNSTDNHKMYIFLNK